jgi:hypothetical protein
MRPSQNRQGSGRTRVDAIGLLVMSDEILLVPKIWTISDPRTDTLGRHRTGAYQRSDGIIVYKSWS